VHASDFIAHQPEIAQANIQGMKTMIHHVSISARSPKHVAGVIAELMDGRMFPFPGRIADSFMAVSGDDYGTLIEVFPETVTIRPGEGNSPVDSAHNATVGYVPFHVLLSVPIDRVTVARIGAREGWRTGYFGRGSRGTAPAFHVIELWIENRLMIEIVTPDMVAEYTNRFCFDSLDVHFDAAGAS
jgi:hypothetical protein